MTVDEMDSRAFELDGCEVKKSNSRALLIYIDDLGEDVWVPKSVIHEDSEVFDDDENSEGLLLVMMWFAVQQGWV